MFCKKRRAFITLLGGAAAWPLAARAQRVDRMRRIGLLIGLASDDPESSRRLTAFVQGLEQSGWSEGRNLRTAVRFGAGDALRVRKYAEELVAMAPDAIMTTGSLSLGALLQETRRIPIVFAQVADPVGAGFVQSLAWPGGNATGFTTYEYGVSRKWLELIKEIAPRVTRIGVVRDDNIAAGIGQLATIQSVAASFGVELRPLGASDVGEIERAILPVQPPTRYELVVNLKTAKALGIEVPQTVLARTDELIE
jgi:putative ABC transport system substrate-binding protein